VQRNDNLPLGLLIECATSNCSVAIADGSNILASAESGKQYDHSSQLLLLIEQCLQGADLSLYHLNYIAISIGPGSYTGLRIGMSSAKALCMSLAIPLVGISTLQIIAIGAVPPETAVHVFKAAMIDARRDEVYLGVFDAQNLPQSPERPFILSQESINELYTQYKQIIWCGDGATKVSPYLSEEQNQYFVLSNAPKASQMGVLALQKYMDKSFLEIFSSSPIYLKSPNITLPKNRLIN
jgi:tRNA threonylcarbamoyladenosine biosynthesis protein TsaB